MSRMGDPVARPDGRVKVTGHAKYAADQKTAHLLYGIYVPAAISAGRLIAVDAATALRERGVVRVLTAVDMPRMVLEHSPPAASRFMPMQTDEVRHQGQPVAIVLAETLEAAEGGAGLVRVSYERATFLAPDEDPSRAPPRAVAPNSDSGYAGLAALEHRVGDAEGNLATAAHRIDAIYVQPSRHNNPMEPSATLAVWEGDTLTLYDAVQHVYSVQAVVAEALKLKPEQVRVICPHTGGGFGCKGYVWPHQILAAAAARIVGRPVKIVLTRADMYANVGYQPRIVHTLALGADEAGQLTAVTHDAVNVTSVSDDFVEFATEASKSMYATPAMHTRQRVEHAHVNLPTALRAPVDGPGTWAMGSGMDELALQLQIDPLDLRLTNYAEVDPKDGRAWSSKKLRDAYEQGATRFGWRERWKRPKTDGHWRIGYGMADCLMGTFRMASKAQVRLKADGTASVDAGYADIGSGTLTVMPQIAADVLGLPVEKVGTRMGDTTLPEAGPTYGSSSTLSGGSAVHRAAEQVREKLARLAHLPPGRAIMKDGRIAREGDGSGQSIQEVMRQGHVAEITGEGQWAPPGGAAEGDGGKGPHAMKTFGVIFLEVGVDPQLGLLRLRRAVGAYSAGRIINPRTARSQMIGGIVWGWGMAAMEQSRHETHLGRWEAKNLSNIALPVNADIPSDIEVIFVDEFDTHASPIGAKGIGELGATGVAAAVANAVFDAIGVRVRALPITPDRLVIA